MAVTQSTSDRRMALLVRVLGSLLLVSATSVRANLTTAFELFLVGGMMISFVNVVRFAVLLSLDVGTRGDCAGRDLPAPFLHARMAVDHGRHHDLVQRQRSRLRSAHGHARHRLAPGKGLCRCADCGSCTVSIGLILLVAVSFVYGIPCLPELLLGADALKAANSELAWAIKRFLDPKTKLGAPATLRFSHTFDTKLP